MPTLPHVLTNQAASETKGQGSSSNSTANRFDFLMGVKDDSIEGKFSSLLTSMKRKFGSFELAGGAEHRDSFEQAVSDIQNKADELKDEQDEEERKKEERLKAERRAQDQVDDLESDQVKSQVAHTKELQEAGKELQAAGQELQEMHSMKVSATAADGSTAMRPSDLLASAFARKSAGVDGVKSTGSVSAAAASSASTGTSTGQGSTDLGADAKVGLTQGGYGTDTNSNSARAARAMMNVDGVTSELAAGDLDTLNARPESSGGSTSALDADAPVDDELASSNTQELKQRLDVLARETHVSKLSLQMANPATVAAERRTAQQLAQLPTSNDQVAKLTAATTTQQKVMSGALTQSGPTSSAEALTQGARTMISANHGAASTEDVQRVASATNVKVSEAKSTSAQELTKLAQSAKTAQAPSNAEVTAAKQAVVANHGALSAANSDPSASQVTPELSRPQGADDVKAQVQRTAARDLSHGVDLAQAATKSEHGASVKAQAALLSLAEAQRSAGATEVNPNLETLVLEVKGNNLDLNAANNVMLEAIKSLKQGATSFANSNAALSPLASAVAANAFGLGAAKAAAQASGRINPLTEGLYETYETSEFYASMFGEDGAAAVATLTGANLGKDEASDDAADSALAGDEAAVNAQSAPAAQAGESAEPELPPELTRFALSGDAAEDAQALHERVMQMAARNLKQLSVELSPNSLGKMKISIALSDDNNAIAVSLQAANPHTRELLQQALPQLRDTLAKQNVATDVNVYDYTRDTTQTAQAVANAASAAQKAKKPGAATAAVAQSAGAATKTAAHQSNPTKTNPAQGNTAPVEAVGEEFVHPATRYVLPDITVAQLSENAMRQRDKLKVATIEDEIAALEAKRAARGGVPATDELLGSVSAKELEEIALATMRDAGIDPSSAPDLLAAMGAKPEAAPAAAPKVGLGPEDFGIERTSLTPMPEIRVDLNGHSRSAEAALLAQQAPRPATRAAARPVPSTSEPAAGMTTTAAALAHSSAQANRLPRRLRNQAPANTLAASGIKRAPEHPVPGMTLRARAADAELINSTTNARSGKAAAASVSRLEALTSQLEAAAAKV